MYPYIKLSTPASWNSTIAESFPVCRPIAQNGLKLYMVTKFRTDDETDAYRREAITSGTKSHSSMG